ncbi:HpcH/HpaI aldolase/citrate lyase family protein [Pusillimonas sp. ANT_WB101]|uniref:HpcH/HpaI aldolase family protein n=1 Tax=Pusillimonas sp. ANT_WB101 TaxID=2597356 RepID=UPI0011ED9B63|nr:HpcH/HpaI aldolase/citrate lyase family protein [Pusillimonas sp. ANT_WB101]KAA0892985.1 HpcH/HpaI aldolase/citrate lyase family protein [Pusillimonas sp. ANT_WB101]
MPCKPNTFKARVAAGEKLIGLWCSLTSATSVEVLSTIDYDWFLLDMEHAPNSLGDIVDQLRVLDSSAACGFVRPPCNDSVVIKRLLDAGAKNLLFPYVQNADEARDIIRATRYAPDGVRGVSTAGRAALYGDYPNYLKVAADEIVIAIQIETAAAIQAIPSIVALAEIDIVFFGPADLSADMGLLGQPEHPDVRASIAAAIKQVTAAGKMAGVLAPNPSVARAYYEAGAKFIAIGSDLGCLLTQAKALLATTQDF